MFERVKGCTVAVPLPQMIYFCWRLNAVVNQWSLLL